MICYFVTFVNDRCLFFDNCYRLTTVGVASNLRISVSACAFLFWWYLISHSYEERGKINHSFLEL